MEAAISESRRLLRVAVLVALGTSVVFLPALGNGFVNWDDPIYVGAQADHAPVWAAFTEMHPSGNWHPLATLSHRLDRVLWSGRAAGHHFTSVLLHAINAGLVVLLGGALLAAKERRSDEPVRANTGRWRVLAAAGFLWAVHPLRVESVAWVSERKDLLCALFYLLGLLAYLRYVSASEKRRRWYAMTIVCFAAAVMSKPMAVSFPLILLIVDWVPLGRFKRDPTALVLGEKLPFLLFAAAAAGLALYAQRLGGAFRALMGVPLSARCAVAVRATVAYLGKTVWPSPLLPHYSYPSDRGVSLQLVANAVVLLVIAFACIRELRRRPAIAATFAAYLAVLLPVLGIVQIGPQAMADRYTYLASIPLVYLGAAAIELALTVSRPPWLPKLFTALATAAACILALLTFRQIPVWHDSESLWSHELRYEPQNMEAHNSRASYYYELGLFEKALADYDAALAAPTHVAARHALKRRAACFNDRAITYVQLGKLDAAVSDESEAIRLMPGEASYYLNRSKMYQQLSRIDGARADWEQARRLMAGNGSSP